MSKITKVLATGTTRTTGADAAIFSGNHEGKLNITLAAPANSGAPGYQFEAVAAHPTAEQLFAAAWSACYSAAVGLTAKEMKVVLPPDTAVEVEVDLGLGGKEYLIQARLNLIVPGIADEVAIAIAHAADAMCPYSKATRGNIDVVLSVVTA